MRKPFDTFCDIYTGPGATTPGSFVGTFACRYVREDGIFAIGNGHIPIPAYMTIEGRIPIGFWQSPFLGIDPRLSDQIAIPSGTPVRYWVIYTDIIVWHGQAPYYRAYLAYLPIPLEGLRGGIVLGGSAVPTTIPPFLGSGGIVLGGSADIQTTRKRFIVPSGGLLLNGHAPETFTPGATDYWRDTFTGTDGTALTSHTGEYTPGGYAYINGTWYLQSNKLAVNTNPSGYAQFSFDPGHTAWTWTCDFMVSSTLYDSGDRYVVWYFRYANSSNCCYILIHWPAFSNTATSFTVNKLVSGTPTTIGTGTISLATGTTYSFSLTVTTSNISCTVDGVNVSVSDSTSSSATVMVMQFNLSVAYTTNPLFENNIVVP